MGNCFTHEYFYTYETLQKNLLRQTKGLRHNEGISETLNDMYSELKLCL